MTDRVVYPGDRVRDSLDGRWRTVVRSNDITGDVFLADGGVMDIDECDEILLPSEPIPDQIQVACTNAINKPESTAMSVRVPLGG